MNQQINPAFPQPNGWPGQQQQQQQPMFPTNGSPGPASGQLNAMLDQQLSPTPLLMLTPANQPTQSDYGYAALKLQHQQAFTTNDSPGVLAAGQWLQANPSRIAEMLQYAPQMQTIPTTGQNPLFVQPGQGTASTQMPSQQALQQAQQPLPAPFPTPGASPPGWTPQPGQPQLLQASPNINPGDANVADMTLIAPEEKKKRASNKAASADMTTTQIVLLGRLADGLDKGVSAVERIATAFERIAAALERPR